VYARAAEELRAAFCEHFWSEEHQRFLRRVVPLDHDRTARLMAEVMAGRAPRASGEDSMPGVEVKKNGHGKKKSAKPQAAPGTPGSEVAYERDSNIDSAMYAIFAYGLLPVTDERVEKTMRAIEKRLWVKTPVGGLARYEDDHYHRISGDIGAVPGNPWFICTLWLAEWRIAKATTPEQLREALPIFDWVANHALPSGVLAEQVCPHTNAPISVSPLTWSHATVVSTLMVYLRKLERMNVCPSCGQPRQCTVGEPHQHHGDEEPMRVPTHPAAA
jgi:GH15 family glucan-1,4-alpha-glucosidase